MPYCLLATHYDAYKVAYMHFCDSAAKKTSVIHKKTVSVLNENI